MYAVLVVRFFKKLTGMTMLPTQKHIDFLRALWERGIATNLSMAKLLELCPDAENLPDLDAASSMLAVFYEHRLDVNMAAIVSVMPPARELYH